MKRHAKLGLSLVYFAASSVGRALRRAFGGNVPGRCVVLYYHSVPAHEREQFIRQMDELVARTRPIAAGHRGALEPGVRYAAVTFDDAFVNVLENAVPALLERRIPVAVFAPSARLGRTPGWEMEPGCTDENELILTMEQLRSMPADAVTIGSHTRNHARLPLLSDDDARTEIRGSREELEAGLGRDVKLFAFPYGAHDERTLRICREAGYERVFLITPGTTAFDPAEFAVPRVPVDPFDGALEFRMKLLGAYSWMPWASALKRGLLGRGGGGSRGTANSR